MIDFDVAFDKLAQFEDGLQIANYLKSEGVSGCRGSNENCPIANWMKEQTGELVEVSGDYISRCAEGVDNDWIENNYEVFANEYFRDPTAAIVEFITDFDNGEYPELVGPESTYI